MNWNTCKSALFTPREWRLSALKTVSNTLDFRDAALYMHLYIHHVPSTILVLFLIVTVELQLTFWPAHVKHTFSKHVSRKQTCRVPVTIVLPALMTYKITIQTQWKGFVSPPLLVQDQKKFLSFFMLCIGRKWNK